MRLKPQKLFIDKKFISLIQNDLRDFRLKWM